MSQKEKLEQRLRRTPPPKDFTWDELITLMTAHGFDASCGSGSHYKFYNEAQKFTVVIAKPHPSNEMKQYQIKDALAAINQVKGNES